MIALSIYEIILFPNLDDFIDMTDIGVFLIKNLVPTLFSYLYYYFSLRNEKNVGIVLQCYPLMYKWLLTHLPNKRTFIEQRNASFP